MKIMANGVIFELNEMKFLMDWNWLKMPKKLPSMQVVGVTCDKENNMYSARRTAAVL